ncbi:MAG: leucyl aminopeptidase [Micavibrio aeruginosavorus]|uniref:Probable cytosol aminopeptidase n=1 Tax=Micavibrio aeruginosavorus TaxID=349221 RepID=A0A2W5MXZ8_9BACT|nr:MAG: leucyl aminopeptidase [Micavibrio aeruginosavorus]
MFMSAPISLSFAKSPKAKTDTVVVFAAEKGRLLPSGVALDKKADGLIAAAIETRTAFKGGHGDMLSVILPEKAGYKQALVIGLGDLKKLDVLAFENAGGKTFTALKAIAAQQVAVLFDAAKETKVDAAEAVAAFASGLRLRDYSFDKYKSKSAKDKNGDAKKNSASLKDVAIVTDAAGAAKMFAAYDAVSQGVLLARDLVSEPPNVLYPASYADIVVKILKPLGVQVEVLDEKKMEKLGFGAHLAVGVGSIRPPRVVVMRWNGAGSSKKSKGPLAFVGKGVTFDTGGISIKPAAGMEEMKMDMGGSAAVVGLIRALALSKAKVDVVGVIGLAENMPSDRAYRPSDIVTSLSGKTIEVLNTDAEGRLVLCDALTYVQKTYKPSMIVDLATLTGAIMVALGYEYAGAFVNDDKLWSQLEKAGKDTGEKLWRMPLDQAYRDEMTNNITDLKNLGNLGRYGGSCSAAGFLEHFIETGTPWAHLDIAGTAWWKSDKPTVPKGATGFGVRLLYRMVLDNYA